MKEENRKRQIKKTTQGARKSGIIISEEAKDYADNRKEQNVEKKVRRKRVQRRRKNTKKMGNGNEGKGKRRRTECRRRENKEI